MRTKSEQILRGLTLNPDPKVEYIHSVSIYFCQVDALQSYLPTRICRSIGVSYDRSKKALCITVQVGLSFNNVIVPNLLTGT